MDDEALEEIDPEDLEGLSEEFDPEADLDAEEPDLEVDIDEDALDGDGLDDDFEPVDDLDGDELDVDVLVDVEIEETVVPPRPEDEEDDDEDELDPDDVEASLDVILKDRLVIEDAEVDEDEEQPEPEDRSEGAGAVVPKRPDEFVCQSCFLVKHPSQLADPKNQLCRDCV